MGFNSGFKGLKQLDHFVDHPNPSSSEV